MNYSTTRTANWLRPLFTLGFLLVLLANAFPQIKLTYSASGTFLPPTGVTSVTVECWGGGGKGASRTSNGGGAGGGGGAYARSVLTVSPGTTYTVNVGGGSTTTGTAGGDSWFSTTGTIIAKGGSSPADNVIVAGAGGSLALSIGTTKFAGGAGAVGSNTGGNDGGGGGSSAGTAATGNAGSGSNGATAPTGGGDGGDGKTGTQGNGTAGTAPGGGGGGGKRTSNNTRTGGNGGNGLVIITYSYTEGACLPASPTIPDEGCGLTTTYTVTLPESGLPTTLGTSAGNARFSSVELIFAHAFNRDLDVTLTSPTGVNRDLMLDRFGTGVNIGNPTTCVAVVLQDGGTALPTTNISNATGTYAPEETLAGYTGNPNGDWILNICDDGAADLGSFRLGRLNFCTVPTTAAAGSAQTTCTTGTVTLAANAATFGTGAWSIVSGPSTNLAQFSNTASNTSTFSPAGGAGSYVLRWSISSTGICTTTTSNVTITVGAAPSTATVGSSQTICTAGTTTGLGGNTPSTGTGAWSIIGGGTGSFSPNATTPNATFAHTSGTVTALRWTITSSNCTSTADVALTINANPTTATVGSAQTICTGGTTTALGGNTPGVGSGAWSIIGGGAGTFNPNNTTPGATFTHTSGTVTAVRWTISNNPCVASTANVNITITQNPTTATVGSNQTICASGVTTSLGGNTPSVGTGAWSVVSGGTGTFSNSASGTSTFTHTGGAGPVVVRWTISNSPCTASTADVSITITPPPTTATVGSTQTICANSTTAALGGNTPGVGTGAWSIVSGGSGTFSNAASGSSTFTHTSGTGPVVLRWTISNSPCTASSATVSITIVQPPTTSNAGSTLSACVSSGTATMAANVPSVGTGAWSFISGPVTPGISTPSSATSNITGMTTAGSYVFRWTISNSPCTASTSDVTIVSYALPTSANAGSTQTVCTASGSITMAANNPSVGTGAWTQMSGPVTASITTPSSNTTGITGLTTVGSYVFRWTITNGSCAASTSNVTITANAPPTTANAGSPQSICTSVGTATMAANTASVGTGAWSQVSGPSAASIVSASSPTTVINGLTTAGTYVFRWTISNNPCTASTSDVSITVVGVPTTANAGSPQTICASSGSVTMNGNTPTVGTGTWSQLSGPVTGTITDVNLPGTTVTGLTTTGTYVFRWRITSSPCTASQNSVTITVAPTPTTADAGVDQDVCVSPGMATMAANTALVGTGEWSQISGPTTASIVDTQDELTDISGFNQVGAYVFRWTITGVGCPPSTDDVTVNVFGSPSTADAGADLPTCYTTGDATMNANAPSVGSGTWTQVSGPVTATFVDDTDPATVVNGMTTLGTYVFRWTISNGPCSTSEDEVTITSGPCMYYSRGNGTPSDAIWSDTPSGTPDLASFTAITSMVVQSGDVITNNSNTDVKDLIVETGGTFIINGATTITTHGTTVDIDGTLTADDNSTFAVAGSNAATISTTGSQSFYDLTIDNSTGATLSGSAVIRNTLLLEDGAFDGGSGQVLLPSNATTTARLGPVGATASYIGDLTMQRYIPAGRTNWRIMGSPVSGETVNEWKDDFTTAGFPGSHVPSFSNPVGSGILWPSVRWYDETNTGNAVLNGLVGATSTAQSLAQGQGFAAWCGTGLNTTTAFTVDVTGNPIVASSPITLPMTYTNTGVPTTDGWNMVSNPLPSPILFSNISRGANVSDFITYFDPATGNNATYDIGLGEGTNGGTNTIQSSQGFWLKANGAAVTTTVDENDKVASNNGGFFGGDEVQVSSIVRMRIGSLMNQYSDETLVVFSEGSPATDENDVPKFVFAHPEAPQVATLGDNGTVIAINTYGQYTTDISIPVLVNVAVNGNYTITVTGLGQIGLSCLRMEDLNTGVITPLAEGAVYTFTALASDDETQPRLLLHASAPLALSPLDATCAGRDDGSAMVDLNGGTADVLWMDAADVVILEQNNVAEGAIMALEAGDYSVQVASSVGCGALHTTFTIDEPSAMEAEAIALPATCPATEDGSIDLTVLGGVAPYTYLWNTNATSEDLTVAAGTYSVEIMDANGCNMAPQEYVVSAGEGPDAGIAVQSSTVMVDDAISFVPTSTENATYAWDFGDNSSSNDAEPVHTYTEPGVYTVTLTVDDGTCTNTSTLEITVESTTGLPTIVGATLNAWVSGDYFVVDHNFSNNDPVIVRILSVNGQLLQQHRFAAAPARLTLSNADLATGIYLLRISNGNSVRTFSVPVAH